jgi:hypothetical protein
MNKLFKRKSKLDLLKNRYSSLMRKSYKMALKDPDESDRVHKQADKVYQEIEYLTFKYGDK